MANFLKNYLQITLFSKGCFETFICLSDYKMSNIVRTEINELGSLASVFHRLYLARTFCIIFVILKAKMLSSLLQPRKNHTPSSWDREVHFKHYHPRLPWDCLSVGTCVYVCVHMCPMSSFINTIYEACLLCTKYLIWIIVFNVQSHLIKYERHCTDEETGLERLNDFPADTEL